MAVFAASFTVSQSADCSTFTFVDTSNYGTNDQGVQKPDFSTREFLVYDYNLQPVSTLPLTGNAVSATYSLSADQWLSVELNLEGMAPVSTYTETHSVLSTCYLELCYAELVADTECGCGCNGGSCNCDSTSNDKVRLLEYIKAAEIFSEYSNPVLAQKQLDAGTALCDANENN